MSARRPHITHPDWCAPEHCETYGDPVTDVRHHAPPIWWETGCDHLCIGLVATVETAFPDQALAPYVEIDRVSKVFKLPDDVPPICLDVHEARALAMQLLALVDLAEVDDPARYLGGAA